MSDSDSGRVLPTYSLNSDMDAQCSFSHINEDSITNDSTIETDNSYDSVFFGVLPEERDGKTNGIFTTFLIVNAALGAGILNFPKSFDEAGGIYIGIVIQAILLIFILSALIILAAMSDISNSSSLQDTLKGACGKWGQILTVLIIAVYCFGSTITFHIIIGDQWDRALSSLIGLDFCSTWYFNRKFTMSLTCLLVILPLSFSRKIDFLKIPSLLGAFAILYVVCLIIYEYYFSNHVPGPIKTLPTEWMDIFLVIPDICFGYQCHVSVIPIYSCMKKRSLRNFTLSSVSAIIFCCFCYSSAASWGYISFGNKVNSDILLSYDASHPRVLIAVIAMALKTCTTYPILLFCGREALMSLLNEESSSQGKKRVAISLSWLSLSLLIAIITPNIEIVIKLLGSLAAIFIFVFPGICLIQYSLTSDPCMVRIQSRFYLAMSCLLIVIGVFIFGLVLTQVFTKQEENTQPSFCTS